MGSRPQEIRVLIADDHAIFREGLRKLLSTEPGLRVVGEAADGAEALNLAMTLRPDILLLDLAMPRVAGLETLRDVSASSPSPRTIILTAAIDKDQIIEALQLGARGVVLKESSSEVLFRSIRAVMTGQYWVGREHVADLVQTLRALAAAPPDRRRRPQTFGLTARELQIGAAVVEGCTNREIAQRFSLSEQTVKHHLTSIFDKLGVSSRLELALFAVHHHLIPDP